MPRSYFFPHQYSHEDPSHREGSRREATCDAAFARKRGLEPTAERGLEPTEGDEGRGQGQSESDEARTAYGGVGGPVSGRKDGPQGVLLF